ncbi:MAG: hypothetical protein AAGA56_27095 [Myxococcota bacterium]
MTHHKWWLGAGLCGALALGALACGDDDGETDLTAGSNTTDPDRSTETSSSGATTTDATATSTEPAGPGDYPAGPYGTAEGDTVAFLEFEGFLSPTATDPGEYVRFDMDDVRTSGSPFVLLHLAATF